MGENTAVLEMIQGQLVQVLAEVRSISSKVGDQAVTVGKLQQQVDTHKDSLEKNWKKTEDLEARLRQVETASTVSSTKLALYGAGAGLFGAGIASFIVSMILHK